MGGEGGGGEEEEEEREGGEDFFITSSPFFTWTLTGSHLLLKEREGRKGFDSKIQLPRVSVRRANAHKIPGTTNKL